MRLYPDFFIIGAAKAGTTSLVEYLSQHPGIFFSPIKEPHFFSSDIKPENFNQRYYNNVVIDLNEYFSQKPLKPVFEAYVRTEEQYKQLFEGAKPEQVKGEASTTYLYSRESAQNIKQFVPEAKIIAVLRNPLERAYSHYLMALKFGFTSLSFMDAIQEDQYKPEKGWGISELFLELGLYYEQLKRYYDHFNSEQIKIIFQDDLYQKPKETLDQLTDFLALASFPFDTGSNHNTAGVPRFSFINELLNKWGLRMRLGAMLPSKLKQTLKGFYLKTPNETLQDHPEAKAFLLDYYREDIRKTENLLNTDLSEWLS